MNFTTSDSESWDSSPFQEKFIQSYFKKRKNSENGNQGQEETNCFLSSALHVKTENNFKKLKKSAKPIVFPCNTSQNTLTSKIINVTSVQESDKSGTVKSTLHDLKFANKIVLPEREKNVSKKLLKSNLLQINKQNSEDNELGFVSSSSNKHCKKLKKKKKSKYKLSSYQDCSETGKTIDSIEKDLNQKYVQLLQKEKEIQTLHKDKKKMNESNSESTTDVCNVTVKNKQVQKERMGMPLYNKIGIKIKNSNNFLSSNLKKLTPFRSKAQEKLQAAKFRYLNEKLYTETGKEAFEYFQKNLEEYEDYHAGYNLQVMKWPINPVDVIINDLHEIDKEAVIADMGCGDAKIAQTFPTRIVHSFDLIALNESVTACDISKVPLPNDSVDIVIFCLSLMGTNLTDYLIEAHRILKLGGKIKIAEVESRITSTESFVKNLRHFGFLLEKKNDECKMFIFLDLKKVKRKLKKSDVPNITLKPCLYKRR